MTKNLLTRVDVEQLVPRLEQYFQKLLYHKKEMAQCSKNLRRLGALPQLVGRVPIDSTSQVHSLQAEARRHYRQFKDHLFAIENMGGEIRNLELGRVDFVCDDQGEECTLTWQLGVTEGVYVQPREKNATPASLFHTVKMQVSAGSYSY